MKYRAEIDGLRALAIIPVVLYHAGFQLFGGGYVGVDVFFVISGYLIATIILAQLRAGTFSLIDFYGRRARRILPALFVMMFVCLPFAWFWLLPDAMKQFSESVVYVSAFASNILFWRANGYFDTATELKPLIHTWSLAVEEQFYVLFPLFLMLAWKFGIRRIVGLLAVVFIISLACAQWLSIRSPSFDFYMLPTRAWELLIGVFVSFYYARHHIKKHNLYLEQLGSLMGFLLIIYAVFAYDDKTPFPSVYALVPTLGASMIIIFATQKTMVGRLLSSKPFVTIGLISYSAYLWHQPMFAFARERSLYEPSMQLMGGLAILSFGLSYLSWKYVERPFRNKDFINRNTVFAYSALCSILFIGLGMGGYLSNGFESKYPETVRKKPHEIDLAMVDNGWCFYSIHAIKDLKIGADGLKCTLGDKKAKTNGILFGDSFAGQYEPFWDIIGKKEHFSINAVATSWCYPTVTKEYTGPVLSSSYDQCLLNRSYLIKNLNNYDFIVLGGAWGKIYNQKKMTGVLDLITLASTKNKLIILMPAPKQFDSDIWRAYKKANLFNTSFDFKSVRILDKADDDAIAANKVLKDHAKKLSNVVYIDRDSLFNRNGIPADLSKDDIPFTLEGFHISIYGSKEAANLFMDSSQYLTLVGLLNSIKH